MDSEYPEYLELFSVVGPVVVKVRFLDGLRSVSDRAMFPNEINKLLSPDGMHFVRHLTFDEHLYQIRQWDVNLESHTVTIRVQRCEPD